VTETSPPATVPKQMTIQENCRDSKYTALRVRTITIIITLHHIKGTLHSILTLGFFLAGLKVYISLTFSQKFHVCKIRIKGIGDTFLW